MNTNNEVRSVRPMKVAEGVYVIPTKFKTSFTPTPHKLDCGRCKQTVIVFSVGTPRWTKCLDCFKAERRETLSAELPIEVKAAWAKMQAELPSRPERVA